jgi:hypothetical protein
MTEPRIAEPLPREVREQAVPGAVPRFLLDDWQERYGIVAGITGRGDEGGRGFDLGLWTDAAVGDVFGTLSVRVGITRTAASGKPSASAAICQILVCRPWPISVPP